MSLSKEGIRQLKYEEQGGMCPLCGEQMEIEAVQLNKRTGKPLKTQKRLSMHELMRIDRLQSPFDPENVNLVHASCLRNFHNKVEGNKVGREHLDEYRQYLKKHAKNNRPAIIMRDYTIRYLDRIDGE